MKPILNTSNLLNYFFILLAVTIMGLLFCLFYLKHVAITEFNSADQRYQSFKLADQLRQSSDDLTKMIRLYVVTGDKKYRDYYFEILAIRNGTAPRPKKYDELYWDLVTSDNKRPTPSGPPKSLESIMLEHHFTKYEFSLLAQAQARSNILAEIEIEAMNALKGKYDDGSGTYLIKGKPNRQLAEQLVFGDEYMVKKFYIMAPIQTFFNDVDHRTKMTTNMLNEKMSKIIVLTIGLVILSTITMLACFFMALKSLSKARKENDILLLNILPETIASRLKLGEADIADEFPQASIMFTDIINFTELTEKLGAKKTVAILNQVFEQMDSLTEKYQVEKVKTIGDNYMAVSGLPVQNTKHATNIANYALAVLEKMDEFNKISNLGLQFRIGITYGAVVAGVIGHKKFVYDVWGNVVNLASRLEASSLPNKIHISEKMAFMLEEEFILEPRGTMVLKGIGKITTYFLLGKKEAAE